MKRLGFLVVLLILILLVHQGLRQTGRSRLLTERDALSARMVKLRGEQAQLKSLNKALPTRLEIAPFIETLTRLARQTGVQNHVAVTAASGSGRTAARRPVAVPGSSSLQTARLKIEFFSSFREAAEYLRLVQNLDIFKRIVDLEMDPKQGTVRTLLTIDLIALQDGHGD